MNVCVTVATTDIIPAFFGGNIAQNLSYRLQKPLLRS